MPTKILVVGGAGYIGSHMVACLLHQGCVPIVLDDLSTGHCESVSGAELVIGNIGDSQLLDTLFARHDFSAVMHFASFIQVGESVLDPAKYYQNNLANTLSLLNAMLKWKVKNFIFSSTAAVYGEPKYSPIDEKHSVAPINPYGQSKRMVEQVLEDFSRAYDFNFMALRYFNAAGADPSGRLGECHEPETHLIPLALQVAAGRRDFITIYGDDYVTPDGTCIRDYVHVNDLCDAHLLALHALWEGKKSNIYNLGTGTGFSVRHVIDVASQVTQKTIKVVKGERRAGDPAVLVADAIRAKKELHWQPRYSNLDIIISHAWNSMRIENDSLVKEMYK